MSAGLLPRIFADFIDHQPDGVVENERRKTFWDMTIHCDHVIEARRPDVVVINCNKLL